MDQQQSIELWLKGKEAWNKWAKGMLVERKKLEDSGEWSAEVDMLAPLGEQNEKTHAWIEKANVNFSRLEFPFAIERNSSRDNEQRQNSSEAGSTNFKDFIFPNNVNFRSCKFKGEANFRSCEFRGYARLSLVHFEKPVSFKGAEFMKGANFSSITSEKSFGLNDTKFTQVPNFTEIAFHAPPVLDDMETENTIIKRKRHWQKKQDKTDKEVRQKSWLDKIKYYLSKSEDEPRPWLMSFFKIANYPKDTRKYRGLAKMAAEANDYQQAMEFFAREVRSRRFW